MPRAPGSEARPQDQSRYWRSDALGGLEVVKAKLVHNRFAPHQHESLMIGVIRTGRKAFRRDGKDFLASPGSISLVNPGDWHTGNRDAGDALRYDALYVTPCDPAFDRMKAGFRSGVLEDKYLFSRLSHVVALEGAPRLEQESALLRALTPLLATYGEVQVTREHATCPRIVRQAREILHASFDRDVAVSDLATSCGTSPSHLMRTFQREVGTSIHAYQTQLRISEGRRRLRAQAALATVALDLGFSDQAHFTRRFRALMGISPGAYRAAWRVSDGGPPIASAPT
ncbi:AraC family transcriptional regulator [Brevundimonas diminuta]|nr:AraC family transcriptional regulator [Brevundimonas diminuta]